MKIFRAITAVAFCAVITTASIKAQTRPGTTTVPTTTALADTKIALLNSDEFADEKTGIVRLVNAMKALQAEFQPRQTELDNLQAQINKATSDLQKAAAVQDPKVSQQQQDKIDQLKRDLQRKGEDAQAAAQKRQQEKLAPIFEEIGKALDIYAKAHGITLILDVTKIQGIVSASESLDITRVFITEFNSKNPATASIAQPKP